jgi:hypothetical protein
MKKLKELKNNLPPAKGVYVDPGQLGQYSAKYQVSEGALEDYLSSRGINPERLSTPSKIAHSKSLQFLKWKQDHLARSEEHSWQNKIDNARVADTVGRTQIIRDTLFGEQVEVKEDHVAIAMGKELDDEGSMILNQLDQIARCVEMLRPVIKKPDMQVPAWVQSKVTLATDYIDTVANYMTSDNEKVNEAKKPKLTALEKFRKSASEREKKHAEIEKNLSKDGSGMTASIDRLEKHLNKEETINEVSKSEVDHHFHQWTNSEHAPYNSDAGDDNKVHQSALSYLSNTNVPKEKHEKLAMHIAHKFHGSGIYEEVEKDDKVKQYRPGHPMYKSDVSLYRKTPKSMSKSLATHGAKYFSNTDSANYKTTDKEAPRYRNEEVEQIDELKKSTVFSWLKKQPVVPVRKPGTDRVSYNQKIKNHSKSWNRALDRLSGYKPTSEDVGDPKAAVNADGLPNPQLEPADPPSLKQKQLSKSARIIKALYKKKGVIKEDLYDHEKEDKSVASYGKKPKFNKTDEVDSKGENKPEAAAIMTGGTTLTGVERDDIEIDPMMRNRPGQPDITKKEGKKKDK